jgi:hypothetical protein
MCSTHYVRLQVLILIQGATATFFALPFYPVRLVPEMRGKPLYLRLKAIDWIGIVLALGMTTALVLPLQWGGYVLRWNDHKIIALFIVVSILRCIEV